MLEVCDRIGKGNFKNSRTERVGPGRSFACAAAGASSLGRVEGLLGRDSEAPCSEAFDSIQHWNEWEKCTNFGT